MNTHVLDTYKQARECFVAGRGARVRDDRGREWLDFLGGIAVSALGHAHPRLAEAIRDQSSRLIHVSNLFRHPYTDEVAGRLARLSGLAACFFSNSGAEANECALKLARKHQRRRGAPERTGFVALEGSFHGRTFGALSVTHTAKYREPFEPLLAGVTFVPPDDAAALARALEATCPAALILEPIQGESGVRSLDFDYLRAARELATRTGTVLIHDEVQCGSGRTGTFLAADAAGVKPDIATLAKPIASSLPMGVTLVSAPLAGAFQPGDHGTTFGGGALVLRASLVFLEELEERGLQQAVRERGAQLFEGLAALQRRHPCVAELRGRGLMAGVRIRAAVPGGSSSEAAEALQKRLYAAGLITNCTGGDVIRLLPPYVVSAEDIDEGLAIFGRTLEESR
jgi:acetylornithine/succinyldiaminopimelate/putrescine aminotransferase